MRFSFGPSLALALSAITLGGCSEGGAISSERLRAAPETTAIPAAATSEEPSPDALGFALVVDIAGEPYVALNDAPEEEWAKGEPSLVDTGGVFVARRDVELAKMPVTAKTQLGRSLRLFDDHGLTCEASVWELALVVRADPRMDTRDEWDGKGYSGKTTKATPSEIATDVWSMSTPVLVGRVRPSKGTCGAATFARSSLLDLPIVGAARPAEPAEEARVMTFARTTPTFVETQRLFTTEPPVPGEPPRPPRWDDMPGASKQIVSMQAGAKKYVWVSVAVENGCGGYNAGYGALLREDAAAPGGYVVVHAPDGGVGQTPRAIVDFGDDAPVMSFTSFALRAVGGAYRFESQIVSSMECPC